MNKTDKQSHHQNNYLVIFGDKADNRKKYIINALNESHAIRIGINKLLRLYPEEIITRARVVDKYKNTTNRVCLKIKQ